MVQRRCCFGACTRRRAAVLSPLVLLGWLYLPMVLLIRHLPVYDTPWAPLVELAPHEVLIVTAEWNTCRVANARRQCREFAQRGVKCRAWPATNGKAMSAAEVRLAVDQRIFDGAAIKAGALDFKQIGNTHSVYKVLQYIAAKPEGYTALLLEDDAKVDVPLTVRAPADAGWVELYPRDKLCRVLRSAESWTQPWSALSAARRAGSYDRTRLYRSLGGFSRTTAQFVTPAAAAAILRTPADAVIDMHLQKLMRAGVTTGGIEHGATFVPYVMCDDRVRPMVSDADAEAGGDCVLKAPSGGFA